MTAGRWPDRLRPARLVDRLRHIAGAARYGRPSARARRALPPSGAEVAYLIMVYPAFRETFVLREMVALRESGLPIDLYVVRPQPERVDHPGAEELAARMRTVQWSGPCALGALCHWLRRDPRAVWAVVTTVVRENWGAWNLLAGGLVSIPKASWMALDMRRRGIRHVHAHFATHATTIAWIVHRLGGIGYSFTAHAHDIQVTRAMLCRKVADAAFTVTVSEHNRRQMTAECPGARIEVVRCGVPTDRFQPVPRTNGGGFRVLSVASLQEVKGIRYLLEAAAILRKEVDDLSWVIIGDGEDHALLTELAAELGVQDIVTMTGHRPEAVVREHLARAHAFAMASVVLPNGRTEGVPVALMEALASAVPAVATGVSGVPELVRDGDTGWLVPQRDAAALAGALAEVRRDPQEAARRAARGRQLVIDEFDVAESTRRLRALFARALS